MKGGLWLAETDEKHRHWVWGRTQADSVTSETPTQKQVSVTLPTECWASVTASHRTDEDLCLVDHIHTKWFDTSKSSVKIFLWTLKLTVVCYQELLLQAKVLSKLQFISLWWLLSIMTTLLIKAAKLPAIAFEHLKEFLQLVDILDVLVFNLIITFIHYAQLSVIQWAAKD